MEASAIVWSSPWRVGCTSVSRKPAGRGPVASTTRARVRVVLAPGPRPASLRLALVHPTLQGEDQAITLGASSPGVYEGAIRAPRHRLMHLRLEDDAASWRLTGQWATYEGSVQLAPQ